MKKPKKGGDAVSMAFHYAGLVSLDGGKEADKYKEENDIEA